MSKKITISSILKILYNIKNIQKYNTQAIKYGTKDLWHKSFGELPKTKKSTQRCRE